MSSCSCIFLRLHSRLLRQVLANRLEVIINLFFRDLWHLLLRAHKTFILLGLLHNNNGVIQLKEVVLLASSRLIIRHERARLLHFERWLFELTNGRVLLLQIVGAFSLIRMSLLAFFLMLLAQLNF